MSVFLDLGTLLIHLGLDTASYHREMSSVERRMKKDAAMATALGREMSLKMTLPIVAGAALALKTMIDLEDSFIGVQKTVKASAAEFDALSRGFDKMSLVTPIALKELHGIGEAAGQLGIETGNILRFTKVMADLGVTTNLTAQEAAMSLARFANITQMSQNDFDRLGSVIVDLGNNLATTEAEIVTIAVRMAGAAKQANLTEAQILAVGAAVSSIGVQAEAGGTAMSRVFLDINTFVQSNTRELKVMARVAGTSTKEFAEGFRGNAAIALTDFVEGLARMKKEGADVSSILEELGFNNIRITRTLLGLAGANDLLRNSIELGGVAWEENTALINEANLRYGSFKSQLTLIYNQIILAARGIGDMLTPRLESMLATVKDVIHWWNGLSVGTKNLVINMLLLAAAIGPTLYLLGGMVQLLLNLKIAALAGAGSINILTGAVGALGAFIAGLAIGTWLFDEFMEVRVIGLAVVQALEKAWIKLGFVLERILIHVKMAWNRTLAEIQNKLISLRAMLPTSLGGLSEAEAQKASMEVLIKNSNKYFSLQQDLLENGKQQIDQIKELDAAYAELGKQFEEQYKARDKRAGFIADEAAIRAAEEAAEAGKKAIADYIKEFGSWGDKFKELGIVMDEWEANAKDVAGNIGTAFANAFDRAGDDLAAFVVEGKANFADLARSILKDLSAIIIRAAIIRPLVGALGLTTTEMPDTGGMQTNALGGVFPGHFQAFAAGGIASRPTLGLIGEGNKPEAVVPLSGGRNIPVELRGGGQQAPTIIINNESGQAIEQAGPPKFDGEKWIVSTVMKNISQYGGIRQSIQRMQGAGG